MAANAALSHEDSAVLGAALLDDGAARTNAMSPEFEDSGQFYFADGSLWCGRSYGLLDFDADVLAQQLSLCMLSIHRGIRLSEVKSLLHLYFVL